MWLVNCEINLLLNWSANWVLSDTNANQATTFIITDTNVYVPVVTLSTQDNATLLQQLKSRFKHTIGWNKYQPKIATQVINPYLDSLIDPSFQGANRLFVVQFENVNHRTVHT